MGRITVAGARSAWCACTVAGIWHKPRVPALSEIALDALDERIASLDPDPCFDVARFDACAQGRARDAAPSDGPSVPPTGCVVEARDPSSHARVATFHTAHGVVRTPCFMPVGTYGAVKGISPEELRGVGSQVVLANAYHLAHRPGYARVRALGGLHAMMGWRGPLLTDSGGYQVFSLRGMQRIDDDGVDYQTHFDGSRHRMTPRSVLEVQAALGSDICMILDHCPPGDADAAAMRAALERTTRWAHAAIELRSHVLAPEQRCFGIVQGGTDLALRRAHLETIAALGFDGLALGGLSVGEPIVDMHRTLRAIAPDMPADRPRYVMGIGTPHDLLVAIESGVDMFDCVMPSRHARNGQLFTWQGRLNIRHARYRDDPAPIEGALHPRVGHPALAGVSRAYLRHLHEQGDPLYVRWATLHNLWFFHSWVASLRRAIGEGRAAQARATLWAVLERGYGVREGGDGEVEADQGPTPQA